ncbi:hypothetical protein RJT34_14628 [Clitoria ternatea]|uniref:DUF7731 domain-containing protein n=1 Tax=Clitoria ternatea TaxID=43366 RepID=A0AAN9JQS0_CLITE
MMAFRVGVRRWISIFVLLYVCLLGKNFGNADDDVSGAQTGGGFGGGGGGFVTGGSGGGAGGGSGVGGGGNGFGGGGVGSGVGGAGGGGAGFGNPAQIISKALLCFNDKNIYQSCEESCRLNENGYLNVPAEKTNDFCGGPCLSETNLVLNCLDNIYSNFIFYNRATVQAIRETIQAGCGYGPERGDFNVAEHIQTEQSKAPKATISHVVTGLATIIMGCALWPLILT